MPEIMRLVTAEELERMPEDARFELWDGQLVPMNPPASAHGKIVIRLGSLLDQHVRRYQLGVVMAESGYMLRSNPDTVFGPDVSFIRGDRLSGGIPDGYWTGAPDLAVEILSPSDRAGAVRRKIDEYLLRGTPMVLVIDPQKQTATIHRAGHAASRLSNADALDLSDVVDGFRCAVREIFE
jgi:Uma2 family endonuclease